LAYLEIYIKYLQAKVMSRKFIIAFLMMIAINSIEAQSDNHVFINKTGDNSSVIIVQNGDYKTYNLNNKKDFQKLIKQLSDLSTDFKYLFSNLLRNQKEQYRSLSQKQNKMSRKENGIKKQIDSLPKMILSSLLNDSNSITLFKLEMNVKALEKSKNQLEAELDSYKMENPSFKIFLDSANKRLNVYDFIGYHKIMEDFIESSSRNAAMGCYLRAKTYQGYFQYNNALIQMERAYSFDKTNRNYLLECARLAVKIDDKQKAINYYNLALQLKNDSRLQKAEILQLLGEIFLNIDLRKSLKYFHESEYTLNESYILDSDKISPMIRLALLKNSLGDVNLKMGNSNEALTEFANSINITNRLVKYPDDILIGITYRSMGNSYKSLNSFDTTAIVYYKKALRIFYKHGVNNSYDDIGQIENEIGSIYLNNKVYDSAIVYFKSGSELYEIFANNNHSSAAYLWSNLGYAYLKINDQLSGLSCLKKAEMILNKYYPSNLSLLYQIKQTLSKYY
jgi:tetratricopeptide (TPR) repeat protein